MKDTEKVLNFVIIRDVVTGNIWDCALLSNDQDNDVYLCPPNWVNVDSLECKDFEEHFSGTRNARYFTDTNYFKVEHVSKTISFK